MKKRITTFMTLFDVLLIVLIAGALVMPSLAQDATPTPTPDDHSFTIVTGALEVTDSGDIMVAGIVIAPAGAFNPSQYQEGDIVIISGNMLNDTTLQATSLELFDDSQEPEATPEATLEVTPEVTPELTPEATLEVTPEVTPEATETPVLETCGNPDHPVAQRIADAYGVSIEEVIAMHCAGNGFGEIIRAFALAEAGGGNAQDFLDRHKNGEGWGQIMHDSDVKPSDLAPGRVLKDHGDDATADTQSGNGNGNGNGESHSATNGG